MSRRRHITSSVVVVQLGSSSLQVMQTRLGRARRRGMFWDPKVVGLLIRARPGAHASLRKSLGLASDDLEPLFENVPTSGLGFAAAGEEWLLARRAPEFENPWDAAHALLGQMAPAMGISGEDWTYVEPDLEQTFRASEEVASQREVDGQQFLGKGNGVADAQDETLPMGPVFAWHLGAGYSQLEEARVLAGGGAGVRIAHLDTGFDPAHVTRPEGLNLDLGWNFVEARRDATDPGPGLLPGTPGHGTGTLSILAGKAVEQLKKYAPENAWLGGAPRAEILPFRIANSVVLLRTSALARAIDRALRPDPEGNARPVDVISLSMGGLASEAWARAVNAAYDAGVCIVAAAGNNFSIGMGAFPTRFIVYPARFRRVIAACGVMANGAPYFGLPLGRMQGNHGPSSKMTTALSAFTPNISWAEFGAPKTIDMNGCGTSSATPQVAAAAALWFARHREELAAFSAEPWRRVEAVRAALFESARPTDDPERFGRGILRAKGALEVAVRPDLSPTPPDSAKLELFKVLFGVGFRAPPADSAMLAVEAAQLLQRPIAPSTSSPFEELIPDPDAPDPALTQPVLRRFAEALREHPAASRALQARLDAFLGTSGGLRTSVKVEAAGGRPRRPRMLPSRPPRVPFERRLRGYAYDPSLELTLETRAISEVTFHVPWEPLGPGPRGEYLEVIDYDPASQAFYEPVRLDEPHLLAQDGLGPSEGNPQFHQQMVYAVASLTIRHFEAALGRPALWSPGPPPSGASPRDDSTYVQRLRIYPHAFRNANAYYSPTKKALLFGYFRASAVDPGEHLPGGLVFSCLSHDIVAHEAAHALLDGLHRRFSDATNPDPRAFHEAFADIVALFQHFTFPEILQHEISKTRGNIRDQRSQLSRLASEFGAALGMHGALREYVGTPPRGDQYSSATEAHQRGAVLVAAVFDAFLEIYEARTRDLLRIATGGLGELPAGAIHPDLVKRLADEAARAAGHVLRICIRALDYCPPVDLTFGDYLRAIITADRDLVHEDPFGYRTAFIDCFRRRGIYPRDDIRSLSEESLVWRGPETDRRRPSARLQGLGRSPILRSFIPRYLFAASRRELFMLERELRLQLHEFLAEQFANPQTGESDARFLGLLPGVKFEVHSARFANRVGPDGDLVPQFIIELLQRPAAEKPRGTDQPAGDARERGCTLIIDAKKIEIRYVIRKEVPQNGPQATDSDALWRTYFGEQGAAWAEREPFAVLHRWSTSER